MSKKNLPHLDSEADEQEFWADHDSTEYVDWSQARPVRMPNLKPSITIPPHEITPNTPTCHPERT